MTSKVFITVLVLAGIIAVAMVDHWGAGIYAGPLYYLPLALAAATLARGIALVMAVLTACAWAVVSFEAGSPFSEPYTWTLNLILQGGVFLFVTWMISTLRRALVEAREARSVDEETGLATRRSFFERAGSVLAICHRDMRPATLVRIKPTGIEEAGHRSRKKTLQAVADALAGTLRASDVTARTLDNEFVALLPETAERDARHALDNLARRIKQDGIASDGVGVAIGAASFTPAPADVVSMIKAAEHALLRARAADGNGVVVDAVNRFETSTTEAPGTRQPGNTLSGEISDDLQPTPRLH